MSELINPKARPEQAAFQLIIELIRADKIRSVSDNADNLLKIYDQALDHFMHHEASPSVDPDN